MSRLKLIWLCSWYPNRLDPFDGDFIQRHARAASRFHDIHVIRVVADRTGKTMRKVTEISEEPGLTEQIIYFPRKSSPWARLKSWYLNRLYLRQALRNYVVKHGRPDLVHVQVPVPAGREAVWFSRQYKVPFVVTEHWGIYNDEVADRYTNRNLFFRQATRTIFNAAMLFISVSDFLARGVRRWVAPVRYEVIPNVVDTRWFYPADPPEGYFRFIHVSNMAELKNAEGILRAFAHAYSADPGMELLMVGDRHPGVRELANTLGLPEGVIRFTGEISYEQVAEEMRSAHCLVLFSQIENSPCVIGEALCCGLPVIATGVGGIPELVDPDSGILIKPGDEKSLADAMVRIKNDYNTYRKPGMAERAAAKFGFEPVGNRIDQVYRTVLAVTEN